MFGIDKDKIRKAFEEYNKSYAAVIAATPVPVEKCDPQMLARLDALETLIRDLEKAFS